MAPNPAHYLKQARQFPLLEEEEERALARRWRDQSDAVAGHKLVLSHLRLVISIARSFRGYGLPLPDLISEGQVGLIKASKQFDPDKGARFSTYAIWWIKAAIREYVLRSCSLVKIGTTGSQRKLFFKLRGLKNRIASFQEGDMHPAQLKQIAEHLRVPERDVAEMEQRLEGDLSLNAPVRYDEATIEWQDWIVDGEPDPEAVHAEKEERQHRHQALCDAISTLSDRERYVFTMRRLTEEPPTCQSLATMLGVSAERVRQIETHAYQKVARATRNYQLLSNVAGPRAAQNTDWSRSRLREPTRSRSAEGAAVKQGRSVDARSFVDQFNACGPSSAKIIEEDAALAALW